MTTLNSIQSKEYNRAQTLTLFLNKSKSIYSACVPFANEVTAFLHNVEQLSVYAALKEKNGKDASAEKKELKQSIARKTANLCDVVTAYALTKGNTSLQQRVSYTYTDIYTLKDCLILAVITRVANAITPLFLEKDFTAYGITINDLTNIIEKANDYNSSIGKANILNHASDYASRTITSILKKIKGNIAQFNRLLHLFSAINPQFVAGFHNACVINNTDVRYNTIEGTIKDSCTGEPLAEVAIVGEGKNKAAVTNASGFFRLTGIKTGTYRLTIGAKGYTTEMVTVKILRGKTIEVNINLATTPLILPAEKVA